MSERRVKESRRKEGTAVERDVLAVGDGLKGARRLGSRAGLIKTY